MSRRIKLPAIASISLVALSLVAGLWIIRTSWFKNYVREKIILSVEDSTGGKVDVGAFRFDAHTLTATVTNFVLHGTESPGSAPLLQAPRIVLRISLFARFRRPAVLDYLGVDHPSLNIIV